ncbi:hypothetical protein P9209_00645 [Prescottella defluvii]|nr:hypothetical protein P9209_00645 [Prescottella defluvii]
MSTTVMHSFLDLNKELSDADTEVYYAALPRTNLATVRRTELGREYVSEGRVFATVEDAAAAVTGRPRTTDSAER